MNRLSTRTLADVLDALGTSEPVPAGGAAAAVGAALGVSLLIMVARLRNARLVKRLDISNVVAAATTLKTLRRELLAAADEDGEAYGAVLAAYHLPRTTEAESLVRAGAVQQAMRVATDVPLKIMRNCRDAMAIAIPVAQFSVTGAKADMVVALELLMASLRGAGSCVGANLATLTDGQYVSRLMRERQELEAAGFRFSERVVQLQMLRIFRRNWASKA